MSIVRQLGSCGMILAFAPLLWVGACLVSVGMAQGSYGQQIVPKTRAFRLADGPQAHPQPRPSVKALVRDPRVLTELEKYVKVWSLEPGACAEFPDADRFPFSWNPFRASALMLRLKQKQAFLMMQKHEVQRAPAGPGRFTFYLAPDPQVALGGRRFLVETEAGEVREAFEL
jgi:hypothetical protein